MAVIFCRIGDVHGAGRTLNNLRNVYHSQNKWNETIEYDQQALQLYLAVGERLGEANVLQEFGRMQEDPQAGLAYLQQAQQLYQRIGDRYSQSRNLLFIADRLVEVEDIDAAIVALEESVALAREIGYEPLEQFALDKITALRSSSDPEPSG